MFTLKFLNVKLKSESDVVRLELIRNPNLEGNISMYTS